MPVPYLNNVATQNGYVDALTVQFSFARKAFAVNVFNAAIYYKVGVTAQSGRDIVWESDEHFLAPSLSTFEDPTAEGFAEGVKFAGIKLRSAVAGTPARVTVS
jgi:hypothetical protein